MYYVVSRNLAYAMRTGFNQGCKGTVYGIYATEADAIAAAKKKVVSVQQRDGSSVRMPYAEVVAQ